MRGLILPTLRSFIIGAVLLGLAIFLPAGTLDYWQAWIFIAVFLISANAIGVFLSLKDPALLERRKKVGPGAEAGMAQKIIMALAILGSIAMLVFSGFDHRFGWSSAPTGVILAGDALVALGFLIDFLVFRENSYGASTIQVEAGQNVISTGPYALMRHPMYGGVLVMLIGVPLALGSWWGLAFLVLQLPVLMWRILDEEKLLERDLPGYREYKRKVRWRLVPYVW